MWASMTKPGLSRKIKKWSWLYHWTEKLFTFHLVKESYIYMLNWISDIITIFKLSNGEKGFQSLIRIFLSYLALILHSIKSI